LKQVSRALKAGRHRLCVLVAALSLCAAAPVGLPGVGTPDRRVPVSVREMPWDAVVRITSGVGLFCTGIIFAPDRVATAAHCLRQPVTGAWARAATIHVLVGYQRGTVAALARVASVRIAPGYDPTHSGASPGRDVAILTLSTPLPSDLAITPVSPRAGMEVVLAGFGQDRLEQLLADPSCHIRGVMLDSMNHPVLVHDCDATRGTSGAPLLARGADGVWHVVGLQVASRRAAAGGIAVPADRLE
jgi:protease YdgD